MIAPEVVGHIDLVGLSGLTTNGKPGNRRGGLGGGADRDPAHPAVVMSMAVRLAAARRPALLDSRSVWSPVSPRTTASPPSRAPRAAGRRWAAYRPAR